MSRATEALRARRQYEQEAPRRAWQVRLSIAATILATPLLFIWLQCYDGRPIRCIWDEKTTCMWEADIRGVQDAEYAAPVRVWRERHDAEMADVWELPMGPGTPRCTPHLPVWSHDPDVLYRTRFPVYYDTIKNR